MLNVIRGVGGEVPRRPDSKWLRRECGRLSSVACQGSGKWEAHTAVLFATDRSVQDPQVIVSLPAPDSIEWQYEVADVQVVGDDVYWLARDKHTDRPSDLLPKWDTTYAVRRTSWKPPAQPEEVYSTESALKSLIIAGNLAFVKEELDADSHEYQQRIIGLKNEGVLEQSSEEKLGGEVVAGDESSLFVAKVQLEPPYDSGVFRVSPDGGEPTKLTTNPFVSDFTANGDTWFFTEAQASSDATLVFSYRVGEAPRQIGCIASRATVHALASSTTEVYAGVFRDNATTVLRFDR